MYGADKLTAKNKIIPKPGQRIKIAGYDHFFPVNKVVDTKHKDINGNVVYTIHIRNSVGILTNKYVDSQTGDYVILEESKRGDLLPFFYFYLPVPSLPPLISSLMDQHR